MSAGLRRIGSAGLQMHGKARDNAVNPFAGGRFDSHWLRGIHFIENRRQAALRQSLHAQVAVRRDVADDEAGLVDRGYDQAMRRAAADRDDHVAEIVCYRVQGLQVRANFIRELGFRSPRRPAY